MRIFRADHKKKLLQPVIALGTFDGVHLGHAEVISGAIKQSDRLDVPAAVVTFEPHPQEVVAPERGLKLLTTLDEREALFCSLGIDAVVVIGFTNKVQKMSHEKFIEEYLVDKLGISWVFVGYDFAFSKKRGAGIAELKQMGKEFGFGVTVIAPVKIAGEIAKSGKIRELLVEGRFSQAVKMLGHPYRISGKIIKGAGRGRKLGFPTINLRVEPRKLLPAQGVYCGLIRGKKCVVNIGSRPTFGVGELLVEAHILNFSQEIYGQTAELDLFRRLRDERQFTDVEELKGQIEKDIVRCRGM